MYQANSTGLVSSPNIEKTFPKGSRLIKKVNIPMMTPGQPSWLVKC
jgi:hypothetical protein